MEGREKGDGRERGEGGTEKSDARHNDGWMDEVRGGERGGRNGEKRCTTQ